MDLQHRAIWPKETWSSLSHDGPFSSLEQVGPRCYLSFIYSGRDWISEPSWEQGLENRHQNREKREKSKQRITGQDALPGQRQAGLLWPGVSSTGMS